MTPRVARATMALLLEGAALVLLVLVVLGKPWPAERGAAAVYVLADVSASVAPNEVSGALRDVTDRVLKAAATAELYALDFAGRTGAPRHLHSVADAGRTASPGLLAVQSTNIEAAIDHVIGGDSGPTAMAIVVLSDGNATAGDTVHALEAAADAGIPVLWRTVSAAPGRPRIAEVLAPDRARPGQDVPVAVRLAGDTRQPLRLTLFERGGSVEPVVADIAPGPLGTAHLRWRADASGALLLDVALHDAATGESVDVRPGAAAIDVLPPAEILYVAAGPASLAQSLRAGGWPVENVAPAGLDAKVGSLSRYAAIVLDDVPASAARPATWTALGDAVRDQGTGLLVLGGERSFAAGSYRDSKLEEVLPVLSKPGALGDAAAVAFVVDKSGSMGASSSGVDRFRLAQRAVVETAATLTDRDSAALIVFDVQARVLVPLQRSREFAQAVSRPWPAQPRGGTRVAPALEAALAQLESATARRRILVLVTDGFVGEAPDQALRTRLSQSRIELIALGVGPDADVAPLARLVPAGQGTILRVGEAAELPTMMRQGLETRRAPIERGRIAVRAVRPLPFLALAATAWPPAAAYDVTMPAPDAVVYLESERGDPLIAYRQAGLGRVVAVTSGLGAWTPDWLRWQRWPALAGGLLEWVMSSEGAPGLSVSVVDLPQALRIDVDAADGQRWTEATSGRLRVQHPSGRSTDTPLRASAPGRVSARIDEPADGLYALTISTPGGTQRLLHLREPRRELGRIGPNPDMAGWRSAGLIRDGSATELDKVLSARGPVEPQAGRAILLALGLFLLGVLVERGAALRPERGTS